MLVNETMKHKISHILIFHSLAGRLPFVKCADNYLVLFPFFHLCTDCKQLCNTQGMKEYKSHSLSLKWRRLKKSRGKRSTSVVPPTFCLAFYPSGCYLSQLTFAISSIILKNCSHISKLWLCFQLLVKRVPSLMCKRWLYRGKFHLLTLASAFRCRWVICRTRMSICESISVLHELRSWSDTKKVA